MTAPAAPAARKCETPNCTADPVPPDWDPEGIDQSDKPLRAWTWACVCGWKRIEPVAAEAGG